MWRRWMGGCRDHTLTMDGEGRFFCASPSHGTLYLGRAKSGRDAASRWKNHLAECGARPEEAVLRVG